MQRKETIGPWPKGIVNSARDYALPEASCLDALNVDFSDEGIAISRSGYSETVAIDNGHSLSNQGGKVMFCNGPDLGVITAVNPLEITTLRSGLNIRPVSYAERGGEVWWSNGEASGRCGADNSDHPWCPPAPLNIVDLYAGVGALPAGSYRVAITHAMSDGEESAASDIETISLVSPGSIEITLPTATAGTDSFNIYCSRADGKIIQKYSTVAAATGSVSITANPKGRQLRDRAFLRPLPAGDSVCFLGGRLLSMKGQFIYYSAPYDYGLHNPDEDFLVLGANGSIMAPTDSGLFVAADKTWFYAGSEIKMADPTEVLPFGAVAGTAFRHPDNESAGWYSEQGLAVGSPDGSVSLVQRANGFIAPTAIAGSAWIRKRDGMAHVVITLDASAAYSKRVSSDFTNARMIYNDDATTMSINLANGATARYGEWGFNSYATIEGDEYGCDAIGLSLIEGNTDMGSAIDAVIHLGRVGFGSMQIKAPESVYVAGKSSAPIVVDITVPGSALYSYPARTFSIDHAVMRHDGTKGLMNARKAWFLVAVRSQNGSSMEVSAVDVVLNESSRRI
jgi:hypothetical protein